jgi:hypothetical protein
MFLAIGATHTTTRSTLTTDNDESQKGSHKKCPPTRHTYNKDTPSEKKNRVPTSPDAVVGALVSQSQPTSPPNTTVPFPMAHLMPLLPVWRLLSNASLYLCNILPDPLLPMMLLQS